MIKFVEKLQGRKLIAVCGSDAETFLQNIVTCELEGLPEGEARFGALLAPQGKILFDFFIIRTAGKFILDVSADLFEEFIKRLMFYRLRAKVEIKSFAGHEYVFACWGEHPELKAGTIVADPRHASLGWRVYSNEMPEGEEASYKSHRISLGIPEGGLDFAYGGTFPHETLMDQFGGVDFAKGCYIGQEVVSRMQHRGTARKRAIKVSSDTPLPPTGTELKVGETPVGKLGSVEGNAGLALARLDRIQHGRKNGMDLKADDTVLEATLPDWVNFSWPEGS